MPARHRPALLSALCFLTATMPAMAQDIALPRSDVVVAETQRIDKWRTGLIVGGVAAGTLAIIINARRGAGHSGGIPVIGGPPENRLPVGFMWRLP